MSKCQKSNFGTFFALCKVSPWRNGTKRTMDCFSLAWTELDFGRLQTKDEKIEVKTDKNRRHRNGKCKCKTIGRQSFG